MSATGKLDSATGIVTVAVAGISGSFSAEDIHTWGTMLLSLSPFILILFLIWRIRQLDLQHKDCTANQEKLQDQIVLAYRAAQSPRVCNNLPDEEKFKSGDFNLADHS